MVRYTNAALNKLGGTDNSVSHVVAGDTDSVSENSKIFVNDKLVSIKDLFNEILNDGSIDILQNGTEVAIANNKIETRSINGLTNIKNVSRHKVSKHQYKISIKNKDSLKITEDHSIMVYRNGEIIECKPNEIKNTDYLIVVK
jgi:intein/homing endonuclease